MLNYNLANPGEPVAQHYSAAHGNQAVSDLTDDNLDHMIAEILTNFPAFGHRMLKAHLKALGHNVPATRIATSYIRVHGIPSTFGDGRIQRRQYSVPGPLSLVHHDGQHGLSISFFPQCDQSNTHIIGLIHYKIVIHCFIDGYSRYVLAIQASNNNKGSTVLDLFVRGVVETHGVPSRVRGDHGVENIEVAKYMENIRGQDRGSYIWGRYESMLLQIPSDRMQ